MPGPAWIDETTAAFERHVAAERGLSPHTVRGYVSDARSLLEHAAHCGASGPGELTAPVLRSWLAGQHSAGASRATLARRGAAARSFTAFAQSITERRRPPILPHNRVIDRLSRLPVPDNGSLPLIRNPNRRDIALRQISRSQSLGRHPTLRSPYLRRRVLHPSRIRKYLRERPLRNRNYRASLIHHHGPRACRPLIQRQNVLSTRQFALLNLDAGLEHQLHPRKSFEQLYIGSSGKTSNYFDPVLHPTLTLLAAFCCFSHVYSG